MLEFLRFEGVKMDVERESCVRMWMRWGGSLSECALSDAKTEFQSSPRRTLRRAEHHVLAAAMPYQAASLEMVRDWSQGLRCRPIRLPMRKPNWLTQANWAAWSTVLTTGAVCSIWLEMLPSICSSFHTTCSPFQRAPMRWGRALGVQESASTHVYLIRYLNVDLYESTLATYE